MIDELEVAHPGIVVVVPNEKEVLHGREEEVVGSSSLDGGEDGVEDVVRVGHVLEEILVEVSSEFASVVLLFGFDLKDDSIHRGVTEVLEFGDDPLDAASFHLGSEMDSDFELFADGGDGVDEEEVGGLETNATRREKREGQLENRRNVDSSR